MGNEIVVFENGCFSIESFSKQKLATIGASVCVFMEKSVIFEKIEEALLVGRRINTLRGEVFISESYLSPHRHCTLYITMKDQTEYSAFKKALIAIMP